LLPVGLSIGFSLGLSQLDQCPTEALQVRLLAALTDHDDPMFPATLASCTSCLVAHIAYLLSLHYY